MPELPEVETVRRGVHQVAVGQRLGAVVATGARTVRRSSAALVSGGASGRSVVDTGRHGKWFWLTLDDGGKVLIHLRMSGQLLWSPLAAEARPKHTHVVFPFEAGGELRFVDPRTFGEVIVVPPDQDLFTLINQGPDALDIALPALIAMLKGRERPLKSLLLDQKAVAGIGNIYADEICHQAGIRPLRRAATLTRPAVTRLHGAIQHVLSAAVEARGSSLADEQYVDLFGVTGSYQHDHRVHARAGQPCETCATPIIRIPWSGRSTYFCPTCQR
jgi:formamidopyrimidine-DNA glycosylase